MEVEEPEPSPTVAPVTAPPASVVLAPSVMVVPSPVAPPAPALSGGETLKAMKY